MTDMDKLVEQIVEEVCRKLVKEGKMAEGIYPAGMGNNRPGNAGQTAGMIDHTLLKPEGSDEQVIKLCQEAREYHFCSVCVNPANISLAHDQLKGSGVKVCTVIGFPLGATTTKTKCFEANEAIENGATEVDMVINIGKVKSADWGSVKRDIEDVVTCVKGRAIVKVIIETCLLTDEEKIRVCTICKAAGADFVKTSTGFSTGGATAADVALMRKTVGESMGVKASGGIKTVQTAKEMIDAGANRLGTSAGIAIIRG